MWNGASERAQRQPRPRPGSGSGPTDRLLRGRRPKKLDVCRRRHRRHCRLVPADLRRRRRAVPVSSPRLRMPLFLRIVSLLVLPLLSQILSVYLLHADSRRVLLGGLLQLAVVPSGCTLSVLHAVALPSPGEGQSVPGEVAQLPAHRNLRPPRLPSVV